MLKDINDSQIFLKDQEGEESVLGDFLAEPEVRSEVCSCRVRAFLPAIRSSYRAKALQILFQAPLSYRKSPALTH